MVGSCSRRRSRLSLGRQAAPVARRGPSSAPYQSLYKLVACHGTGLAELFDLHSGPAEFHNRWLDPAVADVCHDLLLQCLDALALFTDLGPPQTANY